MRCKKEINNLFSYTMNCLTDVVLSLQNGYENKNKCIAHILQNNFYDLYIKVNGGTNNTPILFDNKQVLLKEIPYSILFDIKTLISSSCVINIKNMNEDINTLKLLGININKLYVSTNTQITYLQDNEEHVSLFKTYMNKFSGKGILIKELTMKEIIKHFKGNLVKCVDQYDIIKESKKKIIEQFYSFNLDLDWCSNSDTSYTFNSTGYALSYVNPRSLNNVYGISSIFQVNNSLINNKLNYNYIDKYSDELDSIKKYVNKDDYTCCLFLDIDLLIKNIEQNGVSTLFFTNCNVLIKLNIFKLFFKNSVESFISWEIFSNFILKILMDNSSVSEIIFDFPKLSDY